MRFCHFCGMHSFVSGPLLQICRFTAGKQNCPAGSAPVPAEALRTPATATSRGAARNSSPPVPAAASFLRRRRHVPGGSAPILAAGAARRRWPRPALAGVAVVYVFFNAAVPAGGACCPVLRPRPARSSASLLWTSSSPRPSPQVAPAAATSASALQASKLYSGEAAESISNNAQCRNMENESVPLQRENR